MIITRLVYTCRLGNTKIHLSIEYHHIGGFPISFTLQECLEEFCESVGWRFMDCTSASDALPVSLTCTFLLECMSYEDIDRILLEASYPFGRRVNLGSR